MGLFAMASAKGSPGVTTDGAAVRRPSGRVRASWSSATRPEVTSRWRMPASGGDAAGPQGGMLNLARRGPQVVPPRAGDGAHSQKIVGGSRSSSASPRPSRPPASASGNSSGSLFAEVPGRRRRRRPRRGSARPPRRTRCSLRLGGPLRRGHGAQQHRAPARAAGAGCTSPVGCWLRRSRRRRGAGQAWPRRTRDARGDRALGHSGGRRAPPRRGPHRCRGSSSARCAATPTAPSWSARRGRSSNSWPPGDRVRARGRPTGIAATGRRSTAERGASPDDRPRPRPSLRVQVADRLTEQRRRDQLSGVTPMSADDEREYARSLIVQVLEDHAR